MAPPSDRLATSTGGQPAFKDLFDRTFLEELAAALEADEPSFLGAAFVVAVLDDEWPTLELKARMARVADRLAEHLPSDFATALARLDPVAPEFGGLRGLVFPTFVERFGRAHREASLAALARYTPYSSSEFAVRPWIVADPAATFTLLAEWAASPDAHLRRLASEGCRPRLPWASGLPELQRDPTPILALLEALRRDTSEYVRRSVANNLNDISKDHPELVRAIARRWLAELATESGSTSVPAGASAKDRRRMIKHACRTLLKAGDTATLLLFGFRDPAGVRVQDLRVEHARLERGGEQHFAFELASDAPLGKLRLEYALHYRKKNGSLGPKVFRIAEFESDASQRSVRRKHAFRDLSTRRHHPGEHLIEVRINGRSLAKVAFELLA